MKIQYIVEIEKNEEVKTDGTYLAPSEIVDKVMYNDMNGAGENYKKIAVVDTLDDARKIFAENKKNCSSKEKGRVLTADVLRIRKVNIDEETEEIVDDEINNVYAAVIEGYVISENGKGVDFDLATTYMNDEIREEMHTYFDTDQEFFSEYEKRHFEKYNESFAKAYGIEE